MISKLIESVRAREKAWFYFALAVIFVLGCFLRLWGLGDVQTRILDETSIPKLGYAYIIDKPGYPFPLAHPPVSNYLFAASIWTYYKAPGIDSSPLGGEYDDLNPLSYRWLNAIMSCFIPVFLALIVFRLTRNKLLTILVTLLVSVEATFLVESRVGMNNSHVLFFGLLGYLCVAYALASQYARFWLIGAGIAFGLGFGVKWSSISFILGIGGILVLVTLVNVLDKYRPLLNHLPVKLSSQFTGLELGLDKRIFPWEWLVYLVVIPALVYCLSWVPEYHFNKVMYSTGLIDKHRSMMEFHSSMEDDVHPYCSKWYSWPLMMRPMGYYLQQLPHQTPKSVIYMAQFGNPAVYWLSSLGMLVLIGFWLRGAWRWFVTGVLQRDFLLQSSIIMAYCANFLPWFMVSRCLFIYHYQPALIFAILGLAYLFWLLFNLRRSWLRYLALVPALMIIFAFFNWLPFALALDIPSTRFESLMWIRSWR